MVSFHVGLPKAGQDRNNPRRESSVLVYGLYSNSKLVNKHQDHEHPACEDLK